MMDHSWFTLCVLGFLWVSPSLMEDDSVRINFCCPDGERLRLSSVFNLGGFYYGYSGESGDYYHMPECVKTENSMKNTMEGMEVSVLDSTKLSQNDQQEFVKRKLTKLDTKMTKCGRGFQIHDNVFHLRDEDVNVTDWYQSYLISTIELRHNNNHVPDASEGIVYLNGKPVCHHAWDKKFARVACKMLGFGDGVPTSRYLYGRVDDDVSSDEIKCSGNESSLYECTGCTGTGDYGCDYGCGPWQGWGRKGKNYVRPWGPGVVCSHTESSVDLSGKLLVADKVDTENYCLTNSWDIEGSNWGTGRRKGDYESFSGIAALSCDQCMNEVLCYYVRLLTRGRPGAFKIPYDNGLFIENIVRIADKNGDNVVNFDEFKSKFDEYLKIAFNILDRNGDGSIDEVLTNESIKEYSLNFFEEILKILVEYFDRNRDQSISTDDFIFALSQKDENEDGKVTFSELGVSSNSLPAPLYTAYTLLDEDQDEKLTMEELLSFLRRTFKIIDKSGDCYINIEEVIAALNESNLPDDFQLGLKLVGQQYLTLAKYIVDRFITKADTNDDGKVTFEEIVKFADFSFIDSIIPIVALMGYPHVPTVQYLFGYYREYRYRLRHSLTKDRDSVWVVTLNTFLASPVYQSAPPTQCGLHG